MRRLGSIGVLTWALVSACARAERVEGGGRGLPPTGVQVREALGGREAAIRSEYSAGWPARWERSRDFEQLVLVVVEPLEDRGGYGEDTGGLVAALEQAVRDQGLLRLQADEDAVPPWLREGEGEAREASLRLGGWIDRQGRVRKLYPADFDIDEVVHDVQSLL